MRMISGLSVVLVGAMTGSVVAQNDLPRADVQMIAIEMGTKDNGKIYFNPKHSEFEAGKTYQLVLTNVDDHNHELAMHEVSENFSTRNVKIGSHDTGLAAEKNEEKERIAIKSQQTINWFFVPMRPGADFYLTCKIDGHRESGIFGTVALN